MRGGWWLSHLKMFHDHPPFPLVTILVFLIILMMVNLLVSSPPTFDWFRLWKLVGASCSLLTSFEKPDLGSCLSQNQSPKLVPIKPWSLSLPNHKRITFSSFQVGDDPTSQNWSHITCSLMPTFVPSSKGSSEGRSLLFDPTNSLETIANHCNLLFAAVYVKSKTRFTGYICSLFLSFPCKLPNIYYTWLILSVCFVWCSQVSLPLPHRIRT